jgi:hypothetical protein
MPNAFHTETRCILIIRSNNHVLLYIYSILCGYVHVYIDPAVLCCHVLMHMYSNSCQLDIHAW